MYQVTYTTKQAPDTVKTIIAIAAGSLDAGDKVAALIGNDLGKIVTVTKISSGMYSVD